MTALLSIDPGYQAKGSLALNLFVHRVWVTGAVVPIPKAPLGVQCRAALAAANELCGHSPDEIAVEEMIYYPQAASARSSSEIAKLLHLQAISSYVAGAFGCSTTYYPARVWKKQLPKGICHARLFAKMEPLERARIQIAAARYGKRGENLLDSAGVGMYHLGRFSP